jgi:dihydrofolate synthase/folylpolyglutamate synthase
LFGRWSLINNNPRVIFDSAHNEAGFISVSNELSKISYNKIYILLSFVKGKEIKTFIRHLPKNSNFYFTTLKIERSMSIKEIKSNLGEIINFDEDSKRLYSRIKTEASNDDLIIVTGSNYIAKEIFNEK